jgi:MraZ protein
VYICRVSGVKWKKVEELMFYGEFEHSLDNKGRIIIPSKFRTAMKDNYIEKFFVTRGLDTCLFMFTEGEWQQQENKFKTMPFTKKQSRQFNRLFFSGAVDLVTDKQGRILIPKYLTDYAQIKKDIKIVGVSNRIEIWSKEKWEEFYNNTMGSFEDIAENLMELD